VDAPDHGGDVIGVTTGAVWGLVVLAAFARVGPLPARVHSLLPVAPSPGALDPRLGRVGGAVAAGLFTFLVFPLLAPVAVMAAWGGPVLRRRRRARDGVDEVRRSLPEVVDLLTLAVGAGLTVPLAVAAVARRHDGPVAAELRRVAEEVARGHRCADALDDAGARLGPDARPVLAALVASERYGAPLAEALARLSTDVRADRRRRAEEAARRVPVKLLFPLVLCVLPAFALLTMAPLLAGAFGSLRL
jgi:tight adherence protein C